jgi:hypothetical protein
MAILESVASVSTFSTVLNLNPQPSQRLRRRMLFVVGTARESKTAICPMAAQFGHCSDV